MIALQEQRPNRGNARERLLRQLAKEKNPEVRRRLWVVALLDSKSMSWPRIYARTGISRSTAYSHLREFRKRGVAGLLELKRPGRPMVIPQIVRERFEYLCRKDPDSAHNEVLYVMERELMVFRVLKLRFTSRKLTRWFRHLAQEHNLGSRFWVFRRMRPGYKHLRSRETWHFGNWPRPETTRDFQRILRIDALHYASDRNPRDRELMRRAISATHGIPLPEIAFGDEPHFKSAYYAWGAIPEKLQPIDLFAIWPSAPPLTASTGDSGDAST